MSNAEYYHAMVQLRQEIAHVCYDSTETYELLMGLELVVDRGWWSGHEDVLRAVKKCAEAYARIADDGYNYLLTSIGEEQTKHSLQPSINQLVVLVECLTADPWKTAAATLPKWMTTPIEVLDEEKLIRVEITKKEYEQVLETRRQEG